MTYGQTELIEAPVRVASEDVLVLKAEQSEMYQQCCGCGLTHRIEVSPRDKDLRLRFVNIGHQFPPDLTVETYLERD